MKKDKFDLVSREDEHREPSFFDPFFNDFFDVPMFDRKELHRFNNMMKTDVKEREKDYVIDVEMPGIDKKDINLDLKDGYLTISAKREHKIDENNKKENYIRRERSYGQFSRSFYVGDIKEDQVDAHLENGILQIIVPKTTPTTPPSSRIEIK